MGAGASLDLCENVPMNHTQPCAPNEYRRMGLGGILLSVGAAWSGAACVSTGRDWNADGVRARARWARHRTQAAATPDEHVRADQAVPTRGRAARTTRHAIGPAA
eukprot:5968615-Pleurochrysis_carterae.AAC.1